MNGKEPAFPCSLELPCINPSGLTKRELFAAMAMQGILGSLPETAEHSVEMTARTAVEHADALRANQGGAKHG